MTDAKPNLPSHSPPLTVTADARCSTESLSLSLSLSDRSTPRSDERAENRSGEQELQGYRKAPRAVPSEAIVKELSSARTQEREDVLEVRGGTRHRAKRRRIERASPRGEEDDASDTAADLEATRGDVLVGQAIAREMEDWPQDKRCESRPARSAGGGARGHVERDDHGALPSR